MKICQKRGLYKISEKNFKVFLELDYSSGEVRILNERENEEFIFDGHLDKKTVQRWGQVVRLLRRTIEFMKKEVKNGTTNR